jgi:lipopolysaccharide/colanic/teichoic acid biosynthesis glycosyltransferase
MTQNLSDLSSSAVAVDLGGAFDAPWDADAAEARWDSGLIRAFDVVVAGLLLVMLLPALLAAALLVRLDSPGPIFYRAERVGFRGSRLRMLKFRKMHHDADGLALTMDDDARFTRIGPILARLKLDEIPQLWHVLRGEMSLVGPRPEHVSFVALHSDTFRSILSVRPGMTGLSQVAFAEESRILDDGDPLGHYVDRILPQKIALDVMYASGRSFWLNTRILFWTCAALLRKQVAVNRDTGSMRLRRR